MTKTVTCSNVKCGRCIKIEGSIEGLRESAFKIVCPYCETLTEIKWPMAGDFKVGRCDGDEIPE
jgi:hypothetical protein